MRNFFILSLAFAVLLFSSVGVFADGSSTQNTTVTVVRDFTLMPSPNPLEFGEVIRGHESSVKVITLTPGFSDLLVSTSAAGIFENIWLDINNTGTFVPINSAGFFIVTAQTQKNIPAKIVIPANYSEGFQTGVITYTLMSPL